MRHRAPILAALTVAALLGACSASEPEPAVTIGLFKITSAAVADEAVDGFKEGFLHATGLPEGRVRFTEQNAQGDPTLIQSIARQFADSDADMIAVIGTPAVIAQAELVDDRPIIALAMGDPVGAGSPPRLTPPAAT